MALQQDTFATDDFHIMCSNPQCGFVVTQKYFETKTQFSRLSCPRSDCGATLVVLDAKTGEPAIGKKVSIVTGAVVNS